MKGAIINMNGKNATYISHYGVANVRDVYTINGTFAYTMRLL